MKSEPKVYLAGPDVFKPNAVNIGKNLVALCAKHGLKGMFPLDNEISGAAEMSKYHVGKKIAHANMEMIRECDAVLANLEPFRGPSTDVGTVWECAYAKGLNKFVVAYGVDPHMYYKHKVIGMVPHDGMMVEDFDVFDNIMLAHGLVNHFVGIDFALKCIADGVK